MRNWTWRLFIALLTFAIGITVATMWAVSHLQRGEDSAHSGSNHSKRGVQTQPSMPQGWLEIDMEGVASFYLPAEMKQTLIDDNCHRRLFYNEHVFISFAYGECASGTCGVHRFLQEAPHPEVSQVMVGGKQATLDPAGKTVLNPDKGGPVLREMTICVPEVDDGRGFSIVADYKDDRDLETIQGIIDSIKFP